MKACIACGGLDGLHNPGCTRYSSGGIVNGPRQVVGMLPVEAVEHPAHYGGADDPYEAIKVIEAWGLGFHLGNTVKYISRAGKKSGQSLLQDLKKARWYLDRWIQKLEAGQ